MKMTKMSLQGIIIRILSVVHSKTMKSYFSSVAFTELPFSNPQISFASSAKLRTEIAISGDFQLPSSFFKVFSGSPCTCTTSYPQRLSR